MVYPFHIQYHHLIGRQRLEKAAVIATLALRGFYHKGLRNHQRLNLI